LTGIISVNNNNNKMRNPILMHRYKSIVLALITMSIVLALITMLIVLALITMLIVLVPITGGNGNKPGGLLYMVSPFSWTFLVPVRDGN
jgi:hypothetical protein